MENLVETLIEKTSAQFNEEALKLINEPRDKLNAALKKIPVALVGSLISQLSQPNKTSTLFKLLSSKENIVQNSQDTAQLVKDFSNGKFVNAAGVGSADNKPLVEAVLAQIFSSEEKYTAFIDQFAKLQELKTVNMSALFKAVSAFCLAQITRLMRDKGLGVVGFSELLTSQKRNIEQASGDITKLVSTINAPVAAGEKPVVTVTPENTPQAAVVADATAPKKEVQAPAQAQPTAAKTIPTPAAITPQASAYTKSQEVDLRPPFPMWVFPLLILVGGGWLISQWYTGNPAEKVQVAEVSSKKKNDEVSVSDLQERLEKPVAQSGKAEQMAMLGNQAESKSAVNQKAAKDNKDNSAKQEQPGDVVSLSEFNKNSQQAVDKAVDKAVEKISNKLAKVEADLKAADKAAQAAAADRKQKDQKPADKDLVAENKAPAEKVKQQNVPALVAKVKQETPARNEEPKQNTESQKAKENKAADPKPAAEPVVAAKAAANTETVKSLKVEPVAAVDTAGGKGGIKKIAPKEEISEITLPVIYKNKSTAKNPPAEGATYKLSVTKNGVAEKLHNYLLKNYETIKSLSQQKTAADPSGKPAAGLARADLNNPVFIDLPVEVINFDSIYFNVGSASVKGGLKDIYQVSKVLESYDLVRIKLRGHADATGTKKANDRISLARANQIKSKLVTYGIDSKRIFAEGVADAFPLNDNKTAEERKANRRVDMRVVE